MSSASDSTKDNLVGDAFPTKEELAFFDQFAEIVDGTAMYRMAPNVLVMPPKTLLFKNCDDLPKTATLDMNIGRLFDIFIRKMIQDAGGDLENTHYWLNLRHPGYLEPKGYWIFHKTYKMANGHTLVNLIAKHAQSKRDTGIALDEAMTLSMKIFKEDPKSGGAGRIPDWIIYFLLRKLFCLSVCVCVCLSRTFT